MAREHAVTSGVNCHSGAVIPLLVRLLALEADAALDAVIEGDGRAMGMAREVEEGEDAVVEAADMLTEAGGCEGGGVAVVTGVEASAARGSRSR